MKWVGIDGCRDGWFYVWLDSNGSHGSGLLKTIDEWTCLPDNADAVVLIDMPIGLKETGPNERQCDRAERNQAGADDILDALCGAVAASFKDHLVSLPAVPETDPSGLPMQIVYADPGKASPVR